MWQRGSSHDRIPKMLENLFEPPNISTVASSAIELSTAWLVLTYANRSSSRSNWTVSPVSSLLIQTKEFPPRAYWRGHENTSRIRRVAVGGQVPRARFAQI